MFVNFDRLFFSSIFFLLPIFSTVTGQEATSIKELDAIFSSYEIMQIDSRSVYNSLNDNRNDGIIKLRINDKTEWNLALENTGIISPDYFVTEGTAEGLVNKKGTSALPMKGHIVGQPNSKVSLTFNQNFIYGYISMGATTYFIEPLHHFTGKNINDQFIFYSINDIKPGEEKVCGYETYLKEKTRVTKNINPGSRMPGQCLRVEIVLAADFLMHQHYGSSTAVQNHNIGVLNNVQTNYDDEFADELRFILNQQWISTCSTCDPWTSSTDPGLLLDNFTTWAVSGFSVSHAVGSLWSKRNFDGSTIGLAWVGVVCSSNRYNVLEDFTTNAAQKRVLQAHELGHNFDASHNSGIMAPSVSSATNWSNTSINEIQAHYQGVSCLTNCPPTNAPTPDFTYQLINPCSPGTVQFTNQSTNSTSWLWTFDNGTPATSTAQNPLVTYVDGGTHNVTLKAINGSSNNTITLPIFVNLIQDPISEFLYTISGNNVSFIYTGSGATSYSWMFDDGSNSNAQNPTHNYPLNGIYNVTLTVYNSCGSNSVSYPVEINVIPFVNFSANVTTGCQPQTINFTNLSSNASTYLWTFPGGNPPTSTETNPVVTYNTTGNFSVTLESTNNAGTNSHTKSNYILVNPTALAGFSFAQSGAEVVFSNTSQHANSVSWNFGDGNVSTTNNPTHIYQNNGTYTVVQTVTNSCGSNTQSQIITIALAPVPSFTSTLQGPICAGSSVTFTNTSTYSPVTYLWTFEGGTPATSTDPSPVVTYNTAGNFDVTLVTSNVNGTTQLFNQDLVVVNDKPTVTFTSLGDGLEVDFTQNILNGTNPAWSFGDGQTSSAINPTHTYASEGVYTVGLTDLNTCGTTVVTQNILVQLLPTAAFNTQSTTTCMGTTVQYNNLSSPSVTNWLWTFEGGIPATSTLENPVVTYPQTGTYNVTLTVTNPTGQNSTNVDDYINIITLPLATSTGNLNGNILTLNNTASGSNASWNIFIDTTFVQGNGDQIIFSAPYNGICNVIQTNSNICGQTIADTVQYVINAYPNAIFTVNDGNAACVNSSVNFSVPSGFQNNYLWTFENGLPDTSTVQNPIITYNATGTFAVSLIVSNTLGSDTLYSFVNVETVPVASFNTNTSNNNVQFSYIGTGQTSQLWDFGDGSSSTELNPNHTYNTSGTYDVVLTAQNGCGSDTVTKAVSVIVSSVLNYEEKVKININPNPTSGFFTLTIKDANNGIYSLSIIDLLGKVVLNNRINISGSYTESIDATELLSGMYLIRLDGNESSKSIKLIISK